MNDKQTQRIIDRMARRIIEKFHPEKIILFGSHARGEAGPDSDIDLLVVIRVVGSKRQKANEIDRALADREMPLDLILVTPEQFEEDSHLAGTIVYPAIREGKVLYERAA